jgi:hypothetical protein
MVLGTTEEYSCYKYNNNGSGSVRPKKHLTDPTDQDPDHFPLCIFPYLLVLLVLVFIVLSLLLIFLLYYSSVFV